MLDDDTCSVQHLLGLVFYQRGDPLTAIPYIERAILGNKTHEGFHNSLGRPQQFRIFLILIFNWVTGFDLYLSTFLITYLQENATELLVIQTKPKSISSWHLQKIRTLFQQSTTLVRLFDELGLVFDRQN